MSTRICIAIRILSRMLVDAAILELVNIYNSCITSFHIFTSIVSVLFKLICLNYFNTYFSGIPLKQNSKKTLGINF